MGQSVIVKRCPRNSPIDANYAEVGWLKSVGHCSYSTIETWVEDVLHWIKAQYCWAHLIRDIPFLAEKHPDKRTKAWAEQLLDRSRKLFSAWHRRDEMSEEGFHLSMITHSEQQIRHCVIDCRITHGTRGEAGRRYHERMWTMIVTCKKQNRSVFSFLQESITARLAGQPTPSLLG